MSCTCMPDLAPLSPFLTSPAGFFLHVGSTSATGASSLARLSSPTFQATNSCSVSHSQDPVSQTVWAWWWWGTGSPAVGTPAWGWGCSWPFAGDKQWVFEGGLLATVVPVGRSELFQPHLCEHPVRQQPCHGVQGGCMPLPWGFRAFSPPPSPARTVLPPPWLGHQQPQHLLHDQLHQAPGEGEDRGPGQLLGPGESGLQHNRELQGRLVPCWGKLACLRGEGHRATPSMHPWDQG